MVLLACVWSPSPDSLSMVVSQLLTRTMPGTEYPPSQLPSPLLASSFLLPPLASPPSPQNASPSLLTITLLKVLLHFPPLLYPSRRRHPNEETVLPGTWGDLTVSYLPEDSCCSPSYLASRSWGSCHRDTCSGVYQPQFACFEKEPTKHSWLSQWLTRHRGQTVACALALKPLTGTLNCMYSSFLLGN